MWRNKVTLLVGLVGATATHAAVLRGSVVEHLTGKPLARAVLVAQPVSTPDSGSVSVRTDRLGSFEFPFLEPGAYLLKASRIGFAPWEYGQKEWKSAGTPIGLEKDAGAFLNIRLQRFGSIVGTIVDENETGLPEHDVVAYRNTRPPEVAARAKADERGMFRLAGLEPGIYLVRTAAGVYEEGGYLPTFSKETMSVERAQTVEVRLDETSGPVIVKPAPGRLFTIAGEVPLAYPPPVVELTLVSEMGRQTMKTQGPFQFTGLAPGPYELYGMSEDHQAGYAAFTLSQDRRGMAFPVRPFPILRLFFQEKQGQRVDTSALEVLARRKDLAGLGPAFRLQMPISTLAYGRWELAIVPTRAYNVAAFYPPRGRETARPDGWNEITMEFTEYGPPGYVPTVTARVVVSSKPSTVHGIVTDGRTPVAGVPVFLEAYDPITATRLLDLRDVRTDARGQYQFVGLTPGTYRLMATFEYRAPDATTMDNAQAKQVKLEEGRDTIQDLDLYVIR